MSNGQRQFIASQYAEECAFLWEVRDTAVRAPNYTLADLIELDERIEAQLDGLRILGERGRSAANAELHWEQAGEIFTVSGLAIGARQADTLQSILESTEDPRAIRGIVSAFGWYSYASCEPFITSLLHSSEVALIRLGLAACSVHRRSPAAPLADFFQHENAEVRARALRLAGELNQRELVYQLKNAIHDEDSQCAYWANWSLALLGDTSCQEYFELSLSIEPAYREAAINIALRIMEHSDAISLIRSIGQSDSPDQMMASSSGNFGDPATVPWLLDRMLDPALARICGEAFSTITGLDLQDGFETTLPDQDIDTEAVDDPSDHDTAIENRDNERDDGLPWPDVDKLGSWWQSNKSRYKQGQRYFLGDVLGAASCKACLRSGYQRQRSAAALELAIKSRDSGLFEVRAPGLSQQQQLLA